MGTKEAPSLDKKLEKKLKKIDRIAHWSCVIIFIAFTVFYFIREDIRNKQNISDLEFELILTNQELIELRDRVEILKNISCWEDPDDV